MLTEPAVLQSPQHTTIFISYRRIDDESNFVSTLKDILMREFGRVVFVDTAEIRVGDDWPMVIENALNCAYVLLAVIGPNWLTTVDRYQRRRIDNPRDWVRAEIERSLNRNIKVIPFLLSGVEMPPKDALPEEISALVDRQYLFQSSPNWEQELIFALKDLHEKLNEDKCPLPKLSHKNLLKHKELSKAEIQQRMDKLPADWKIVISPLPGEYPNTRTELYRRYKFASFSRAVAFMYHAVATIDSQHHHPRWENMYRTVSVFLTTWDVQHKLSDADFKLAETLDSLFYNFESNRET